MLRRKTLPTDNTKASNGTEKNCTTAKAISIILFIVDDRKALSVVNVENPLRQYKQFWFLASRQFLIFASTSANIGQHEATWRATSIFNYISPKIKPEKIVKPVKSERKNEWSVLNIWWMSMSNEPLKRRTQRQQFFRMIHRLRLAMSLQNVHWVTHTAQDCASEWWASIKRFRTENINKNSRPYEQWKM